MRVHAHIPTNIQIAPLKISVLNYELNTERRVNFLMAPVRMVPHFILPPSTSEAEEMHPIQQRESSEMTVFLSKWMQPS